MNENIPSDEMLAAIAKAPDSQLDANIRERISKLRGVTDIIEVRTQLHHMLDDCVRYSLASSFMVKVIETMWVVAGGKVTDPAPWRNEND